MKRLLVVLALVLVALPAAADEGMWMPQQIPALADRLRALGFTGDPNAFADLTGFPMGAIVSLGGCSASFVSPEGLIVTNNHCVQGALQYNSKPERNLMVDGFLAKTKEEELWNGPGSRVFVTVSVKDVTAEIMGKIDPKITDRKRYDVVEQRVKAQTAACEKGGLRCNVAPFFEGMKWYEIGQMEIQDVRLVYSPAQGIGNFGGETDNWQWPRHTGDFSFYRAYVSKDGKAVPFSKENVPYRPKHFLKVSPKGASPGELVFVAGYPGRTARLNPYAEVKETVEWSLPRSIKRATDRIAILEALGKDDKETALKVAQSIRGLNNGLTKNKGVLQGMVKGGLLAQKEAQEKEFVAWIAAEPARKAKYGEILPAITQILAERTKTRERDALLAEMSGIMGSALGSAQNLYRFSIEKPKKDADRDPAFQERNWQRMRDGQERAQRTLSPKADRALMKYALADIAKLPAGQRIDPLDKEIGLAPGMTEADAAKACDAWLEKLYAGTKMYDKDFRMSLFDKTTAEQVATKDSMVLLAAALYPMQEANREKAKERSGANYRLGPPYAEAFLAKNGGLVSPDANSTLRVTYGTVKGVEPRDGLFYLPQTTLKGILEKATGTGEFNAPKAELDAIKAVHGGKPTPYLDPKLKDVPVDFLSNVDTTGGNSGSATLNSAGELVGLLFDGTFDTVAADYLFDKEKTRSIQVDSRNMLWVMTEVDKATNLLVEMGFPAK
ncbi:MAG TPA: S46 family peptidase [Thermoanaerobaculia bacterium]|nr:S46 family peptidase [Thermoanaerobaculia bacterium]HQR67173.1 S46 family peptidase [Thermoanaerobaculia bacterium]